MAEPSQIDWEDVPSRNLLSESNLDLVRRELEGGSIIFGWHAYYYGGCSHDWFCFADFGSYYRELTNSRPGDHFTIYSRDTLVAKAWLRLGHPDSNEQFVGADQLAPVKQAMAEGKELVFLWCRKRPEDGGIECSVGTVWEVAEQELPEYLGIGPSTCGEFLFFLPDLLDEDEDGNPITTVSAGSRMRIHAVADGKRPNEAGLTPTYGCY